jgi:hypothetical protein
MKDIPSSNQFENMTRFPEAEEATPVFMQVERAVDFNIDNNCIETTLDTVVLTDLEENKASEDVDQVAATVNRNIHKCTYVRDDTNAEQSPMEQEPQLACVGASDRADMQTAASVALVTENKTDSLTDMVRTEDAELSSVAMGVLPSQSGLPANRFFDFGSLYVGILPNVLKEAPVSAIYLGSYEFTRQQLSQVALFGSHIIFTYLMAGAVAELCCSFIRVPAEALKVRTQTSSASVAEAFAQLYQPDNIATTSLAWQACLLRDILYGGIQLVMFESIKNYVVNSPLPFDVGSFPAELLFGTIAGSIAAFLTTPVDRVTTVILTSPCRLQEDYYENTHSKTEIMADENVSFRNASPLAVVLDLLRAEGPPALFKASVQRTLYWAPATSIFLAVYFLFRQAFM